MQVTPTSIEGVLVFTPTVHADDRGWFSRTFDADVARAHGIDPDAFVQDSQSRSRLGVIRGMHLRGGGGEAKYVRCASGAMFDVIVDLRPSSPTFLRQEHVTLDDVTHRGVYIPAGCGHGWQALGSPTDACYRIDQPHDPTEDISIRFDDPDLAIPWPDPSGFVSEKDRAAESLTAVLSRLT
jgi:dTDP-4-dehydrorhamnose 3,5-epimerase